MQKPFRAPLGFTLLEIMATVGIVGALTAAALPLADALQADRAQSALNSAFASALEQARARALADGQSVSLCASVDGDHCHATNWSSGWRVYRGEDTLSSFKPERALVLEVVDAAGTAAHRLAFNAQGFTAGDRAYFINSCDGGHPLNLRLERNGRLGRAAANAPGCEG